METSEIITQYIENVLQCDATAGEVAAYTALVESGTSSLEEIRDLTIESAEARDDVYPVVRAYEAVFGRVPDEGGLEYWVNVYRGVQDQDDPVTTTVDEGVLALLEAS